MSTQNGIFFFQQMTALIRFFNHENMIHAIANVLPICNRCDLIASDPIFEYHLDLMRDFFKDRLNIINTKVLKNLRLDARESDMMGKINQKEYPTADELPFILKLIEHYRNNTVFVDAVDEMDYLP